MPGYTLEDTPGALRESVRLALESAWVDAGYTAPNAEIYPWLWLWDSCFHALVWAALGQPDRGVEELSSALANQHRSGFVPHMGYQLDPAASVELWGCRGSSSITQPPMYGHAIAELVRAGVEVPGATVDRATAGLGFLFERRARDSSGLIRVVHPWETGCDDSPRWGEFCPGGHHEPGRWRLRKSELVDSVARGPSGEPLDNPDFAVAPAGFNALVSWNAAELADITNNDGLRRKAVELAELLDDRWSVDRRTWIDAGRSASGSGAVRTADALLPLLVCRTEARRKAVAADLVNPDAFGSEFGIRGVHLAEPSYDPTAYWRGPVWPQLCYLLWVALTRCGSDDGPGRVELEAAEWVRRRTVAGARRSSLAEYWHPDSGSGMGAIPQSWTGLVVLLDEAVSS